MSELGNNPEMTGSRELTQEPETATMPEAGANAADQLAQRAEAGAPEDTRYSALEAEIANQRDIIAALQEQNERYAKQITGLIRNGASVTPPDMRATDEDIAAAAGRALPEDYVSLRELDLDMSLDKLE